MARKNVLFIDIDNIYYDYAKCIFLINNYSTNYDYFKVIKYSELRVSIKEYKNNKIVPVKLEEPIDGKNMNSSVKIIPENIWKYNVDILTDIHFHIRINYNNSNMNEYLTNLHYLSLLITYSKSLIKEKRFSIFLVPRSGHEYPFATNVYNNVKTDTDLYKEASSRLRVLIQHDNRGIIYGVEKAATDNDCNIVKALDFKSIPKNNDCFPIITLHNNINTDYTIQDIYVNTPKTANSNNISNEDSEKLNHYDLLFDNGNAGIYIEQYKELKNNRRFGYANNTNSNLALVDFLFESAFICLKDKLEHIKEEWKKYCDVFLDCFAEKSIFSFIVFSFIIDFENNKLEILQLIKKTAKTADEICNAVSQIVQNALQYSSAKECSVTFLRQDDSVESEKILKIIISDYSTKTILDSFYETLDIENKILNAVTKLELFNINFDNYKKEICKANSELALIGIELRNFFNSFDIDNNDLIQTWYNFRQTDSSAHIGLALFSHIMKKNDAQFSVNSNSTFDFEKNNFYCNYNIDSTILDKKDNSPNIPGTEFNISLPLKVFNPKSDFNMAQLNFNKNYYDNYETYAAFIDSSIVPILYKYDEQRFNEIVNSVLMKLGNNISVKFVRQLVWTNFWFKIFTCYISNKCSDKIYKIDFNKMLFIKEHCTNQEYEIIIKGFISAIGYFSNMNYSCNINLAIINVPDTFINCFEDVTVSLSLKKFPENLQLFVACSNETKEIGEEYFKQIHMFGNSYGLAVKNSYILSIEHGTQCYGSDIYEMINNLFMPFSKYVINSQNKFLLVPFALFLQSNNNIYPNMYFEKISKIAEKSITEMKGYKFENTHIRVGNKVHMNKFYEMSFLFYRTTIANSVAFEILRNIKNSGIDLKNDNILFYGYASYSQAILMSITMILDYYRKANDSVAKVTYAVYQYNLQSEANANNIQIYYKGYEDFRKLRDIKVVQIVPISSTLTTFSKMWVKFENEFNSIKNIHKLVHNHTVMLVRDDICKKTVENNIIEKYNGLPVTNIEDKYYKSFNKGYIETYFDELGKSNKIYYIIIGNTYWNWPEKCPLCYPKCVTDEIPLIETDPTSTVPAQQIFNKKLVSPIYECKEDIVENNKRISLLKGVVYYGHIKRGKNHYQYYINTQYYFAKASEEIKKWLKKLSEKDNNLSDNSFLPYINVIFSPEHNTNVGFSQFVNAFYFNGTAEIISVNEDKEFRSNFICEHSALKNTIYKLFKDFYSLYHITNSSFRPVRFYFADDTVITGTTVHKASNLLQSLIPKEYLELYTTAVFEKCFFLIDRISDSSKASYVIPTDYFYSFCHIDVSNIRVQGDSCIGCKILADSKYLMERSATRQAVNYWNNKIINYMPKSFEEILVEEECKDDYYYRLVLSHIVKNLFEQNMKQEEEVYSDMIFELFNYFTESKIENNNYKYIRILSDGLIDKSEDKGIIISNLIKVITRPFIIYNHNIKTVILKFIILLSESIIDSESDSSIKTLDSKYLYVLNNIKKLYADPIKELNFLKDCLYEATVDMNSTYLIRKSTITKTFCYFNRLADKFGKPSEYEKYSKEFWLTYSVFVQKVIDRSSDEIRSLWLEHLLVTGEENTEQVKMIKYLECDDFFYNRIKSAASIKEGKDVKDCHAFKTFCNEVFLSNNHLVMDALKQLCSKSRNEENFYVGENKYFKERLDSFKNIDRLCFCENEDDFNNEEYYEKSLKEDVIEEEKILYKSFETINLYNNESYKNKGVLAHKKQGRDLIKDRYETLLSNIKKMVIKKYGLDKDGIRLALLTRSDMNDQSKIFHRDLDIITHTISLDKNSDLTKAKYIIKERIMIALNNNLFKDTGYFIKNALGICEKTYKMHQSILDWNNIMNTDRNSIQTSHRIPYFILCFDNSDIELRANTETKKIVPVYLYVSMVIKNEKKRKMLPWLIMRDILSYRNKIMKHLAEDFTSDVMQKYAHTIDTEAILEHEKVISHTPMREDKEILKILGNNGNFDKNNNCGRPNNETMLKWVLARDYCNTMVARLYNRVFRNINKTFDEIIDDSKMIENRDVMKLYVPQNSSDGNSFPVNSIMDILPNDNESDYIYMLFKDIIYFNILNKDNLYKSSIITKKDKMGMEYTYNLDYTKNIIYRICFDALRFSVGAGAGINNFLKRIECHYEFKKKSLRKLKYEQEIVEFLLRPYIGKHSCEIIFDIENSEGTRFDWFVIKNKLHTVTNITTEEIIAKLKDPLDFKDGHMSLLTEKEYFAKFLDKDDEEILNNNMFRFENDYFITRLPIIKKESK